MTVSLEKKIELLYR